MAKIKNVSGEDLVVPVLGGRLVQAGQVIEVPDELVYSFTQQEPNWRPDGDAAETAHEEGHRAYLERAGLVETEGGEEVPVTEEPAGNASREEWAAYAVGAGLATPEELDGKGRDEIRDTYGSTDDGSN